jgi:23S rRNA (adenine1618-N6)-methyltransferase
MANNAFSNFIIPKKKEHPKEKARLHKRSKHRERYDLQALIATCPELAPFVKVNIYNDESIDFFNQDAVRMLNKALLMHYYEIKFWSIPQGYLCPPIPGRADYIHYMADLMASKFQNTIPLGKDIRCLDIGMGANCVYPMIGTKEYGWSFVGTDIDPVAMKAANKIVELNPTLKDNVELRLQKNKGDIYIGMIKKDEFFDLSICNPPFHSSQAEAQAGSIRKLSNLKQKEVKDADLNFGGQSNELWCDGGEQRFIQKMISQSKQFSHSCLWFSAIVSKRSNLQGAYEELSEAGAVEVKTIPMGQGNKISRVLAWTFHTAEEQTNWAATKWKK